MSIKAVVVGCCLWFGLVSPVAANVNVDYEKARQLYVDGNYPKVIAAVTKLLPSEDISQTNRANLHTFRGVAYSEEESYEKLLARDALTYRVPTVDDIPHTRKSP